MIGSKLRNVSIALAAWTLAVPLVGAHWASAASAPSAAPPAASGAATKPDAPFVEGEILVGFDPVASPLTSAANRAGARQRIKARSASPMSTLSQAERLVLDPGVSTAWAIAALKAAPGVRYAEPNYIVQANATSNDPMYTGNNLWGMYGDATTPANTFGSHAGEAWANGTTGSSNIVIGVIDEGIQVLHPDLAANIWTNPGEIAGNGIDDDGNGYIDDVNGYDFVNNDGSVYDSTADDHATHVAGTIGGVGGNGIGVAGVNWNVTMISAKFLGASGGTIADAVRAVDYFNDLKTRYGLNLVATSNSWGGGGFSQSLLDAINRGGDRGILFVAAAGNSTSNNDSASSYPSNYQCTNNATRGWDCVIAVAAIQSNGDLAGFSSFGATTVDIGAPGVSIVSTVPDGTYASYSGTSMATPHVSGAVALCASANPSISARDLRAAVVESTVPTQSLAAKVVNAGRLDVTAVLKRCVAPTGALAGDPTGLTATALSPSTIRIDWSDGATNETGYEVQQALSTAGGCGTFATIAKVAANATQFWSGNLAATTPYCLRVRATQGASTTTWSNAASETTLTPPTPYSCNSTTSAWIDPRVAGTLYTLSDDSAVTVTLPWAFSIYGGAASTTLQISSNGYVRFGTGTATSYSNTPIVDPTDPNAYAAPWFDDLNPGAGGEVWASEIGSAPTRQYVVAWIGVPIYSVTGSAITFEVVLDESTGNITFQYLDTVVGSVSYDRGASATVGIEDPAGAFGTQVSYNSAKLSDGAAYRCTQIASPPPPQVTTASLPVATRGVAYSQTLAGTAGTTPYTWSVSSGSLPAGLSLNATSGVISGTPSPTATTTSFTVSAVDAASPAQRGSKSFTVTVAADPVSITTASLAAATRGVAYNQTLQASGGTPTYAWSVVAGSLPGGLVLDPSSGVISGTPAVASTSGSFTVGMTDSSATVQSATKVLSIDVADLVSVNTTTLANATTTVLYSSTLTASGGTGTFTWAVTAGSVPAGLTLSSTGLISGRPTTAGTSSFTVRTTDTAGRTAGQALSITVVQANPPGAFAKSSPTNNATKVSRTPRLSWAASNNATGYEYCISTTASCPIGGWVSVGTSRSVTLTSRAANTAYWWQARAINTGGTTLANAGTWWKFTTTR